MIAAPEPRWQVWQSGTSTRPFRFSGPAVPRTKRRRARGPGASPFESNLPKPIPPLKAVDLDVIDLDGRRFHGDEGRPGRRDAEPGQVDHRRARGITGLDAHGAEGERKAVVNPERRRPGRPAG